MGFTSRRTFLTACSLGMLSIKPAQGMRNDPIGRTRPSHLKLSIAAYSYRKYLTKTSNPMTLFDFSNLAADLGMDAVEPTSYYFPETVTNEYLHGLKRHAFLLGLDLSGTAIRNDFCIAEGKQRTAEFEHVKRWIKYASILGAPVIRVFAGSVPQGDSEELALNRAIDGFQSILPVAQEHGVMLALENHGGITATPEQMMRLIDGIDHPYFAVNLDAGNFDSDDPYRDLETIAPFAVNVQLKTEIKRQGVKEEADLERLITILQNAHYSGYVVLEYEAAEDPMVAIPRYVKQLRSLINR